MAINLRDFQQEAVNETIKEFEAGKNILLINLPTGVGKTLIGAALAKHYKSKKILFIAHRDELITQAVKNFKLLLGKKAPIGICKARQNNIQKRIVIGSVQTCSTNKRLEQLQKINFDILLIDECHHSVARTYKKVIDQLNFRTDKSKLCVGFTATPDKKGMGDLFQKIVYQRSISTMVNANYLSPVIGRKILTTTSLDGISIHKGDFAVGELSNAVNTKARNNFIVQKFKTYALDRKGIAFCVDVKHCIDLADAFTAQGIKAAAVYGRMDKDKRIKILKQLKKGDIQIVTSCGILTEGFDEPSINIILMCRPTRSKNLYIQCVGRGLRKSPETGKLDCLVLDFSDSANNLNSIVSLSSTITDAKYIHEKEIVEPVEETKVVEKIIEPIEESKENIVQIVDEEFDILGQVKFIWIPLGDNEYSLTDDDNEVEIIVKPINNGYVADVYQQRKYQGYLISEPLPLHYATGVCEDWAKENLKINFAQLDGSYLQASQKSFPTYGQIQFLKKNNISCTYKNKAEASFAIRQFIALQNKEKRSRRYDMITSSQKTFLERVGVSTDNMSKADAMQVISKLKQI